MSQNLWIWTTVVWGLIMFVVGLVLGYYNASKYIDKRLKEITNVSRLGL